VKRLTQQEKLLRALRKEQGRGKPVDYKVLAKRLRIPLPSARRAMAELVKQGKVARTARGQFSRKRKDLISSSLNEGLTRKQQDIAGIRTYVNENGEIVTVEFTPEGAHDKSPKKTGFHRVSSLGL
jgi:hypothetical protein